MPSENPTPTSTFDLDLIHEQAILCEFLDTIDSNDNDDDVSSVYSVYNVYSICKHPPKKERTLNVIRASRHRHLLLLRKSLLKILEKTDSPVKIALINFQSIREKKAPVLHLY